MSALRKHLNSLGSRQNISPAIAVAGAGILVVAAAAGGLYRTAQCLAEKVRPASPPDNNNHKPG